MRRTSTIAQEPRPGLGRGDASWLGCDRANHVLTHHHYDRLDDHRDVARRPLIRHTAGECSPA